MRIVKPSSWLGQRWKGIRKDLKKKNVKPDLRVELYDLNADGSESEDVSAANPDVVAEIERVMKSERTVSGAFPFPALDRLAGE